MMIEIQSSNGSLPVPQHQPFHQHPHLVLHESSGGEDSQELRSTTPKKRAETWVQEETRALIGLRRETDSMFNTSKSNKHLWEQISAKMREKGFDRSPTMCTDKWRNLLKEYKKSKHQRHVDRGNHGVGGGGSASKMSCYKEIEQILRERGKNEGCHFKASPASKVDTFVQFSDKGFDDTNVIFGPVDAVDRSTLNLERRSDHEGHPLSITADAVAAGGVSPWNWRETSGNGERSNSYAGRVISIKCGDFTKRIGIDGTADAIKEAIRSAFGLRTKRAFWLEDEDGIVRALDRDMPLGNYTLNIDEGLTIKVCSYEQSDHMPIHAEDKTFYTEEDFRKFLSCRGWTCLREYNGFRNIDNMDDLCPGEIYRGVS